jgi:hypothetical protein
MEPHLLRATTPEHLLNMRLHPRTVSEPLHSKERLIRSHRMMTSPQREQTGLRLGQRKQHAGKEIRLTHLPRDTHTNTADRGHELAIGTTRQHQLGSTILPTVKRDTELDPQRLTQPQPITTHDPRRGHQILSDIR